ncbi:MAG: multiheme c-type cytochrome [Candidatus Eisenbacteria bacterium]
MRRVPPIACALALLLGLGACGRGGLPAFYASRPVFEQPFAEQRVPKGLKTLSADECGSCHTAIWREWRQSVHAQAWVDEQFQAELAKQPGVAWLCVNCHTPLVNQLDSLVVRLEGGDVEKPVLRRNPRYAGDALRDEAITCAVCHVRDGVVEGPYGNTKAPHATRANPALRSAEFCLRCHQAVQAYPGKTFVCTFATGDEWRAGPFFAAGTVCQDCHMPAVERPLADGSPVRRTGMHGWIGSHLRKGHETLPALWDSLAAVRPPGVALGADSALAKAGPDSLRWTVRATNANAGHRLPTGDPERAVLVTLAALDARGDTLASHTTRIAQRWEWWPAPRRLSDDRLAPGETRTLELRWPAGTRVARLVATAVNERISDANADYHRLPASYPRRVEVARVEFVPPRAR